jgi:hypothetical protein
MLFNIGSVISIYLDISFLVKAQKNITDTLHEDLQAFLGA